jgi:DNA-binding HxlR family transcriptional regulator
MPGMPASYGQFCPVAKAAEIFATRWTPLILRELMAGAHGFNDIQRGVPLISRAVLVARLRELEAQGVIERRRRADGTGHEYWLTPAGDGFRSIVNELGRWGMTYTRDRIRRADLDPGFLMWGLRRRADVSTLPDHRIVVRFEFLRRTGEPNEVPRHVAVTRTFRRGCVRQGPRIFC